MKIIAASDVQREPLRWLWPGWIPLGKVVMLDGDPGRGKSTVTMDLAARISTGSPMPDGSRIEGPGNVIMVGLEDDAGDTVLPRLMAAGADIGRVGLPDFTVSPNGQAPVKFPSGLAEIEEAIAEKTATLCVFDPIMGMIDDKIDSHKDQSIRDPMWGLRAIAYRQMCTIICVRHLNKDQGKSAIYRGGGSIGFIGAARAGYVLADDPNDPKARVLACNKLNVGIEPPSLRCRIIPDEENNCGRVSWEGESSLTAEQILGPQRQQRPEDVAEEWLTEQLAGGRVAVKELQAAAEEADISWRTVRRAQKAIGVRPKRESTGSGGAGAWFWELAE